MLHLPKNALSLQHQSINNESLEQGTQLNEAQLSILRLLGRMKTVEQVNELRQVISIYYAKKAFIKSFSTPTVFWQVSPLKARTSVSCETFKPGVQKAEYCLHS